MRPGDDALPLRCESLKPLSAQHDYDVQFVFEFAYRYRQCRLADMACRRSAAEVALAGKRQKILQLLDRHLAVHQPNSIPANDSE